VVVRPDDYWVVAGDPQSKAKQKLTLTTCTPKYTSRNRLIVWADLIKTELRK
jgi:sortase (surface protein transpeptidase)